MTKPTGQVRITGGTHRSRKIVVENQPGLRPTGDRIRETLFNWLGHNLHGLTVLDLYAGSGILAFEAASRGAKHVLCIDNNNKTVSQLRKNLTDLKFEQVEVSLQAAKKFTESSAQSFDLIFLDPPFDTNELSTISGIITPLCKADGYLYREFSITQDIPPMAEDHWHLSKHKQAGQVRFELWQKT